MALLLIGGLIVGGLLASGYVAHGVSQALAAAGVSQHYNTIDEVSDDLRRINRPDLAQQLNVEVARGNAAAFSLASPTSAGQPSLLGSLGLGEVKDILPLALMGFVLLKVLK